MSVHAIMPPLPAPRPRRPIPGFGLSLGYSIVYLSFMVLLPLIALALSAARLDFGGWMKVLSDDRVISALRLSFGSALAAAMVNSVFGPICAYALVRFRFPGRRILDALVDVPFALPTAVAGIALASLYAPSGPMGKAILQVFGVQVGYTSLGVTLALIFVGLPFTVRTLQPVLRDLEGDVEQAAALLGADRSRVWRRVIVPSVAPALVTAFTLSFARGAGEYGSVIFIAGNFPRLSEIAPLLIIIRLEESNYAGASAIAMVMLLVSICCLVVINLVQALMRERLGHE